MKECIYVTTAFGLVTGGNRLISGSCCLFTSLLCTSSLLDSHSRALSAVKWADKQSVKGVYQSRATQSPSSMYWRRNPFTNIEWSDLRFVPENGQNNRTNTIGFLPLQSAGVSLFVSRGVVWNRKNKKRAKIFRCTRFLQSSCSDANVDVDKWKWYVCTLLCAATLWWNDSNTHLYFIEIRLSLWKRSLYIRKKNCLISFLSILCPRKECSGISSSFA